MFRTILLLHPNAPLHFVMCDHPLCGMQVTCTLNPSEFKRDNRELTSNYLKDTQEGLFKALTNDGWRVGMTQTLCPVHVAASVRVQEAENVAVRDALKEMEAAQQAKQSRIEVAHVLPNSHSSTNGHSLAEIGQKFPIKM